MGRFQLPMRPLSPCCTRSFILRRISLPHFHGEWSPRRTSPHLRKSRCRQRLFPLNIESTCMWLGVNDAGLSMILCNGTVMVMCDSSRYIDCGLFPCASSFFVYQDSRVVCCSDRRGARLLVLWHGTVCPHAGFVSSGEDLNVHILIAWAVADFLRTGWPIS